MCTEDNQGKTKIKLAMCVPFYSSVSSVLISTGYGYEDPCCPGNKKEEEEG